MVSYANKLPAGVHQNLKKAPCISLHENLDIRSGFLLVNQSKCSSKGLEAKAGVKLKTDVGTGQSFTCFIFKGLHLSETQQLMVGFYCSFIL